MTWVPSRRQTVRRIATGVAIAVWTIAAIAFAYWVDGIVVRSHLPDWVKAGRHQ